eukprot:gnl/MRDRNA2_/MRDRNA2_132538_c0_seq1.p1 gnl/MRDRNA2_/MRDRNA2_132538_c0~~gnl/MRDRNA2_/MRDRNA2_132538_c0_seq1.p1  ORF type:complete len:417 (+),score=68.30 gnl/MRDRNA2_/MRDRNA2_132538_c0_seq1:110-1360(+)
MFQYAIFCLRYGLAAETWTIDRIPYEQATFAKVYEFRYTDRPVIITDVPAEYSPCFGRVGGDPPSPGNLSGDRLINTLLKKCRWKIQVSKMADTTVRKGVVDVGELDISDFLGLFTNDGRKRFQDLAGHLGPVHGASKSIRDHCPSLWQYIRFPAYFTGDLHLRYPKGKIEHEGLPKFTIVDAEYPSLYITQKGARMTYHVDGPETEVWLAVCRGKKKYRITPLSLVWQKFDGYVSNLQSVLQRLAVEPDNHPFGLPVWQGSIELGDVMYMPAGAVHSVETQEDTINIVNNFLDAGGISPFSQINLEMLRADLEKHRSVLEWTASPEGLHGTDVFDNAGIVTSPQVTARGFPTWGDLVMKWLKVKNEVGSYPKGWKEAQCHYCNFTDLKLRHVNEYDLQRRQEACKRCEAAGLLPE